MVGNGDDVEITRGTLEYRAVTGALFRSFTPDLPAGIYQATLTGGLMDQAGNGLASDVTWSFQVYAAGLDTDGDGVPDDVEVALGLNPSVRDSDGNGTDDGAEDNDNDGLTNAVEVILLRDPLNVDSDGDGIRDGDEDEDGDGLTDGEEVALGTNPFARDTDGDGFSDADEVNAGSDPLVARLTPLRYTYAGVFISNAVQRGDQQVGLRNDAPPPLADNQITVFNEASPDDVAGMTSGPTFTVENTAP